MDNLTGWECIKIVFWTLTIPLWLPPVWVWRKWEQRRRPKRPGPKLWIPLLLVASLIGCTETPEAKVERASIELSRVVANIERVGVELTKAEKALTAEKLRFEELKAKLNGLKPVPAPQPAPPNPVPPPGPAPSPGPLPPVPQPLPSPTEPEDGRFELAKAVYRIAKEVASPDRVAEAQALAGVFDSVAAQVAAGTLNGTLLDPQWHKISVALTTGNKPIMAKHLTAWKSAAEQLSEAIGTKYSEDKLKSNSDWAELLSEIARGLRGVK